MKLYIKYMLSNRCKMAVKEELKKLGLHFVVVDLGEVEIMEELSAEQHRQLRAGLLGIGLELMEDKKGVLIEKIKKAISDMLNQSEETDKVNFSDFLSEKLDQEYTFLANLFSEVQGITIAQYIIARKVELIKDLILFDQLSITEIAWKMNYSSVAHLSNQFKKVTGLTPSQFKQLKNKKRNPVEEIETLNDIRQ
ncbi:helix-turn-helix domain-containing protein [Haliscomenobacter hydrossis]|uniref:Transcriptional regulator, AraC family n=1 Tax=Haliscomenobacter hydrossis (strain ATCC 27775 / DSM 1100 / LMG 10767 / O) TaxID=760192 RepID=F4KUT2_HALH1|nr:helix-turn-helix domain-containing protein [Haliscomenobacter hydrossis]AEE53485.1 transcriptional regulator, AraC family [Haliscomenobacter hydrossis DSM 1100]